jgi:hypothetical protein
MVPLTFFISKSEYRICPPVPTEGVQGRQGFGSDFEFFLYDIILKNWGEFHKGIKSPPI